MVQVIERPVGTAVQNEDDRYVPLQGDKRADVAWVFPGQGAPINGKDVYDKYTEAKEIYELASDVANRDIVKLCSEGSEDELRDTAVQQPVIAAGALAYLVAAIGRHPLASCVPGYSFGQSVGEYMAHIAVQSVKMVAGFRLISRRGSLMADAGKSNPGTLGVVIGLDEPIIRDICDQCGTSITNYNGARQYVVGGEKTAVALTLDMATARGASYALPLEVSGAFHTQRMAPAEEGLEKAIKEAQIDFGCVPVLANVDAQPKHGADAISRALLRQLTSAVLFDRSVETAIAHGITTFVCFGDKQPGNLIKRHLGYLQEQGRVTSAKDYKVVIIDQASKVAK